MVLAVHAGFCLLVWLDFGLLPAEMRAAAAVLEQQQASAGWL